MHDVITSSWYSVENKWINTKVLITSHMPCSDLSDLDSLIYCSFSHRQFFTFKLLQFFIQPISVFRSCFLLEHVLKLICGWMHGKSCFSQVAHLVWKKSGWWEARETEQGLWDGEIVEGCERQTTLGVDQSWGREFWPQGLSRIWMDGRRGGDGKVANFQRWAPIISFTNTTRVRMKKHLFVIHFVVLYLVIAFWDLSPASCMSKRSGQLGIWWKFLKLL